MNPMDDNRRSSPRVPIELKVEYRKLNGFFSDYTQNISLGGTFIATRQPMPIGTMFRFQLAVPNRPEPFELLGEVTWSKADGDAPGMGIRFVWSDEQARRDFEQVVERMMVESLGPEVARKLLKKDS